MGFLLALPCPSPLLIWMKKQGEGLAGDKNYDAAENGPGKLPDVRIRLGWQNENAVWQETANGQAGESCLRKEGGKQPENGA